MEIMIILFSLIAWQPASADNIDCNNTKNRLSCVEFVRNYDADTVTVNLKDAHPLFGHNVPVRVAGIDTPEMKTSDKCEADLARRAQKFVQQELSKAKRLDLVDVGRDKYFRILADVSYDGKSLAKELLSQGFAYPYHGGTKRKQNWCLLGGVKQVELQSPKGSNSEQIQIKD